MSYTNGGDTKKKKNKKVKQPPPVTVEFESSCSESKDPDPELLIADCECGRATDPWAASAERGCVPIVAYIIFAILVVLAAILAVPSDRHTFVALVLLLNMSTMHVILSSSRVAMPYDQCLFVLVSSVSLTTVVVFLHILQDHADLAGGIYDYISNGGAGDSGQSNSKVGPLAYISIVLEMFLVFILWAFVIARKDHCLRAMGA